MTPASTIRSSPRLERDHAEATDRRSGIDAERDHAPMVAAATAERARSTIFRPKGLTAFEPDRTMRLSSKLSNHGHPSDERTAFER